MERMDTITFSYAIDKFNNVELCIKNVLPTKYKIKTHSFYFCTIIRLIFPHEYIMLILHASEIIPMIIHRGKKITHNFSSE